MSTILLTGATGLVGSSLTPLLQERGDRILYLVRRSGAEGGVTRLMKAIGHLRTEDIVLEGDVTLPWGGLKAEQRREWRGQVDLIIHSAASTKFDDRVAEETREINVGGTETMLQIASDLEVPEFHFVSTSYVAGNSVDMGEDLLDLGQLPRNAYERSKITAERLVRAWRGGRFSIYRPSIVVGESKSGVVASFSGYYGFFISFWRLLASLREKWKNSQAECEALGIRFNGGVLEIPLHVDCSSTSTINLVPIDWLSETITELVGIPASGMTFNLTHPSPPRVRWVIDESMRYLGFTGLSYGDDPRSDQSPFVARIQASLERQLERYSCYVQHEPIFKSDNLRRVLGESYRVAPEISPGFLETLLAYAVERDFGRAREERVRLTA